VSAHVVDVLELVEVEIEQRPVVRRTAGAGQRLIEFVLEMLPIDQAGQRVVLAR
jgi:hypothetical protein